jgi:hypothetical protein
MFKEVIFRLFRDSHQQLWDPQRPLVVTLLIKLLWSFVSTRSLASFSGYTQGFLVSGLPSGHLLPLISSYSWTLVSTLMGRSPTGSLRRATPQNYCHLASSYLADPPVSATVCPLLMALIS